MTVPRSLKGKPLSEVLSLTNKAVVEALDGLPPVKVHCSVLAEEAVKAALLDYFTKNGIENDMVEQCRTHCASCGHEHGCEGGCGGSCGA